MSKAILGFGVSVTRLAALAESKLASTPSNDDIVKFIVFISFFDEGGEWLMSSHVDNRAVNMSRKKMRIQHKTQNTKHDPNRRRLKNTKHDTNRRRTHKTENMIQIEEEHTKQKT